MRNMERNVGTASGRGEDPLLSTAHGAAENASTCSATSSNDAVDSRSLVDVRPGQVPLTGERSLAESVPGPSSNAGLDDDRPPVTEQMLRVLELRHVTSNAKLRHDVNFDPYLHFRPNTDTIRGERQRRKADAYWAALGQDLKRCATSGQPPTREAPEVPPRVELVLKEIGAILCSLVPPRDIQAVKDTLDSALLMQQISRASLDYPRLAAWMAGVLKTHCAPMRDAWVDEMVGQFQSAAKDGDQMMLVNGIRTLFGILEAMKLVRNLRTLLIEDTVRFEQQLFVRRIEKDQRYARSGREWYKSIYRDRWRLDTSGELSTCIVQVAALVQAVTKQLALTSMLELPATFEFDLDRLYGLRSELHNVVALEVCMRTFERVMSEQRPCEQMSSSTAHGLRARILSLTEDCHGPSGLSSWSQRVEDLALEMTRMAAAHHQRPKATNTTRTSSTTTTTTTTISGRGTDSHSMLQQMELRLRQALRPSSSTWRECERSAMRFLTEETLTHTVSFLNQSLLAVATAQAPETTMATTMNSSLNRNFMALGVSAGNTTTTTTTTTTNPGVLAATNSTTTTTTTGGGVGVGSGASMSEGMLVDLARKLAHVLSLHWRVFAYLVYLRPEFDPDVRTDVDDHCHGHNNGDEDGELAHDGNGHEDRDLELDGHGDLDRELDEDENEHKNENVDGDEDEVRDNHGEDDGAGDREGIGEGEGDEAVHTLIVLSITADVDFDAEGEEEDEEKEGSGEPAIKDAAVSR